MNRRNTNNNANMNTLLHHRQMHSTQPHMFRENWCRSKRSIETLGYYKQLVGHEGCVNAINFSQSGELLVSGSDDTTVKVWDISTAQCLDTLNGHISNVFVTHFLPYRSNKEIISGANDADLRHFDLEKRICTTYTSHSKKILGISINPLMPETFISCSADGTARLLDLRMKYSCATTENIKNPVEAAAESFEGVLPQAFGGGRMGRTSVKAQECLLLDYSTISSNTTLLAIDTHPNGHNFLVASSLGDVLLFDLRKIDGTNPRKNYVNVYRNLAIKNPHRYEITGAVFSKDGSEIVATCLNDNIYVFDTFMNYEKAYELEYFPPKPVRRAPRNARSLEHNMLQQHLFRLLQVQQPELFPSFKDEFGSGSDEDSLDFTLDREEVEEEKEEKSKEEKEEKEEKHHSNNIANNNNNTTTNTTNNATDSINNRDRIAPPHQPPATFKRCYEGHYSIDTIKGVNFYGPNSEYVMSGSDDYCIYIWEKKTGELLRILKGHEGIVNSVIYHPTQPMIASAGIDPVIKLWENVSEFPTEAKRASRKRKMAERCEENSTITMGQEIGLDDMCVQQ